MAATPSSASRASATARAAWSTAWSAPSRSWRRSDRAGGPADSKGALRAVLGGPFGAWIVGFIAVGLFGFALWRLIEGVTDADNRGTSLKGYVVRAAHVGS